MLFRRMFSLASSLRSIGTFVFALMCLNGCGKSNHVEVDFTNNYSLLRDGLHSGMTQQQIDDSLKSKFKDKVARFSNLPVNKIDTSDSGVDIQPVSIDDMTFNDAGWPKQLSVTLFFTGTSSKSFHELNIEKGDKVDVIGTISNIEVYSLSGDWPTIYIYIQDGDYVSASK